MEAEIGGAAQAIWKLFPGRSKLIALNLGGGTQWETTRTLRHYLDKYHLFDALGNSTGMDDVYGNRVANFRRMLGQHIERGLWYRVHYHYIGPGLSSSEANFRSVLDIVDQHKDVVWVAGMADIHKYLTERAASKLALIEAAPNQLTFEFACLTDPALYDQPLTIETTLPANWKPEQVTVQPENGSLIPVRPVTVNGQTMLRFELPPRGGRYVIERTPR